MIKNSDDEGITVLSYFLKETTDIEFTHPVYKRIMQIIEENANEGVVTDTAYFLGLDDQEIRDVVVELSMSKYEISENWKLKHHIIVPHESEHLKDVAYSNILHQKFKRIEFMLDTENEKLKHAEDTEIDRILDESIQLKRIHKEIGDLLGIVTVK
jgi:hypothetical protein